ncbi:hypothetical protein HHK36_000940 [Tetracentron sinense]|uniref:Uncharacterized protein n=1 Tax=Tetracentron sinense TaxID=13715 RepID=A0A835DRL6_TETSI|nr:hypothetical protein HHK36_000940 [Tetracentron sinense]
MPYVSTLAVVVCHCEWELKSGDGIEGEKTNGFSDKFDFGPVPSKVEVENAVSALQQVLSPAAFSQLIEDMFPSNWDKDVADQTVYPKGLAGDLNNPRILRPHGSERVYDAFHLLLTDSSVQRMVMSLSSDKAVWDAVLNNHVVRELKESLSADQLSYLGGSIASASSTVDACIAQPKTLDQGGGRNPPNTTENNSLRSSDENYDVVTTILRWILDITRANIMEFIEKITKLVNEVLRHPHPEGENCIPAATDLLEEKMRSSFLLSILVFIIVVLTRFHKA